jgi:hypothetical protein
MACLFARTVTAPSVAIAAAVLLPALAYQCSWHEIHSSLALAFVHFRITGPQA